MSEPTKDISWELTRNEGKIGTGNWAAFPHDRVDEVLACAERWKDQLTNIDRPWLCWCVDEEWCVLQQRLVVAAGWTPVVGTDGRFPAPSLVREAVFIDFNETLKLPAMWMHFPMDFVFAFCEKLAYWHSDILPPVTIMKQIARQFESIENGELIGIKEVANPFRWIVRWRKGRSPFYVRWAEFCGCTSAGASKSQWESGCGWWRNPHLHPNTHPLVVRKRPEREHGVGIRFWERYFGGQATRLHVDIDPWHYTAHHPAYIRRRNADRRIVDSKREELQRSFDLAAIVKQLQLP